MRSFAFGKTGRIPTGYFCKKGIVVWNAHRACSLALQTTKGKPLQSRTCPLPQSYKTLSVDDLEKIRGRECNLYFKRLKFFVLCLLPSSLALKGQKATKSAANKSIASVILDSFAIVKTGGIWTGYFCKKGRWFATPIEPLHSSLFSGSASYKR